MNKFFKKYSLPLVLKFLERRRKPVATSVSYVESKNILLLFTSDGNQKIALVKALQNKLEKEGKNVECLYLLMSYEDMPDVHADAGMEKVEPTDFSIFGNIKKASVSRLLEKRFDILMHADMECNDYTNLILTKTKARCRIGRYFDKRDGQYDMMIKMSADKKIKVLVDQIHYYAKAM
jgi:hypothetical protein